VVGRTVRHFFEPASGQTLYHYTSAEGAVAILENQSLWLSEFSMTNDASEYIYAKEQFINAYQNSTVWIEEVPRWMANIKLNAQELATTMMIGCLTEEGDDIGLWDRYASKGSGCVIGIDAHWLWERAGVAMRRVSYDPVYLSDFVNSGLMMLQEHYESNPNERAELAELATMFVLDIYAFKDPRFRSENEIRISRLTIRDQSAENGLQDQGGHRRDGSHTDTLPVQVRDGVYGETRFVALPLREDGGHSAITSLGIGPNMTADTRSMLLGLGEGREDLDVWTSDAPLR